MEKSYENFEHREAVEEFLNSLTQEEKAILMEYSGATLNLTNR